jgi:mRNA interferase HigB
LRLISRTTLFEYAKRHPGAAKPLADWEAKVRAAVWKNLVDARKMFPHADQVTLKSKRVITVFNIHGNDYRLLTAIHYDTGKVFIRGLLTHAEYSKNEWKKHH